MDLLKGSFWSCSLLVRSVGDGSRNSTCSSVPQSFTFTSQIHFSKFNTLVRCVLPGVFGFSRHLLLKFIISIPPTGSAVVFLVLKVEQSGAPLPCMRSMILVPIPPFVIFGLDLVPISPFIFRVGLVQLLLVIVLDLVNSQALSLPCENVI